MGRTLSPVERGRRALLGNVSEREWQASVCQAADDLGVSWYHPAQSLRDRAGYPDLTLWGPGGQAWMELKKLGGYPKPAQRRTLAGLREGGAVALVLRPGQMDVVEAVLLWLAGRQPRPDLVGVGDTVQVVTYEPATPQGLIDAALGGAA